MEEKEIEPIETLQAKLDEESKTITINTVRPSIIIRRMTVLSRDLAALQLVNVPLFQLAIPTTREKAMLWMCQVRKCLRLLVGQQ